MSPQSPRSPTDRARSRCAPGRFARDPARRSRRRRSRTGPCRFDALRQSVQHDPRGGAVAQRPGPRRRAAAGQHPVGGVVHEGHAGRGRRPPRDLYVDRASEAGAMPVLVAYNLPFRDCAQYSAGGATNTAEYEAWIDGLVAGIGDRPATVILEPDGLGIIPHYTTINGDTEWCQPAEADRCDRRGRPLRPAQLRRRRARPRWRRHPSIWTARTAAGWASATSPTASSKRASTGRRVLPQRVELRRDRAAGEVRHVDLGLHQHQEAERRGGTSRGAPASTTPPNPADFSTWGLTDAEYDKTYASTGATRDAATQAHFVLDTSRNGQGPWTAAGGVKYSGRARTGATRPDAASAQRPTTSTGNAAHRRVPVDQGPRRVGRQVLPRDGRPARPRARHRGSRGRSVVRRAGARAHRSWLEPPVAPLDCHVTSWERGCAARRFIAAITVRNEGATGLAADVRLGVEAGSRQPRRSAARSRKPEPASRRDSRREQLSTLRPGKTPAFVADGQGRGRAAVDLLAQRRRLHVRLIPPKRRRGPVRRLPPLFAVGGG